MAIVKGIYKTDPSGAATSELAQDPEKQFCIHCGSEWVDIKGRTAAAETMQYFCHCYNCKKDFSIIENNAATIKYKNIDSNNYVWFDTLERFVEWELRANKGTQTQITKDFIQGIYEKLYPDAVIKSNTTKDFMINEILKKKSLKEIYEEWKDVYFGIKPYNWKCKFNLSPSQMQKMAKEGFLLHEIYKVYEKVFTGTYASVAYYKAEDYFNTTPEEVELWKEENIRGYKKRKEKKLMEG